MPPPPRRPAPSKNPARSPPPRSDRPTAARSPPPRSSPAAPPSRKGPPPRKPEAKSSGYDPGDESPDIDSEEDERDNDMDEPVRPVRKLAPAPKLPKNDLPPPPKADPESKIKNVIYNIAIGKLKTKAEMDTAWFWDEKVNGAFDYEMNEWLAEKVRVAAGLGMAEAVQFFLSKGADIDGFDTDGNTALHFAVMGTGKPEDIKKVIKTLFDAGADVDRTNNDEKSAKGITFERSKQFVDYLRELEIAKKQKPEVFDDDDDGEVDIPYHYQKKDALYRVDILGKGKPEAE